MAISWLRDIWPISSLTRVEIGAVELTHGHEVAAAACGATAEAAASGAATTASTTAAIRVRLRRHGKLGTRTGNSSRRDMSPCSSGRNAPLADAREERTAARKVPVVFSDGLYSGCNNTGTHVSTARGRC